MDLSWQLGFVHSPPESGRFPSLGQDPWAALSYIFKGVCNFYPGWLKAYRENVIDIKWENQVFNPTSPLGFSGFRG
jgi:hypothetical protein